MGVDRNSLDLQFRSRAENPNGNFRTVGDKEFLNFLHGRALAKGMSECHGQDARLGDRVDFLCGLVI